MVNITISLPEETVKKLRRTVKERYGGKKGALSGLINEAVEEKIASQETVPSREVFTAYDGRRVVAESQSLDELALILHRLRVDPRAVRILSSVPVKPVVRAGLRGRRV